MIRHRYEHFIFLLLSIALTNCSHAQSPDLGSSKLYVSKQSSPKLRDLNIVEGVATLKVENLSLAAEKIKKKAKDLGGRVVDENLSLTQKRGVQGRMKVRVMAKNFNSFLKWLATIGDIRHQQVHTKDVSRKLFDNQIALKNLNLTLDRLRLLLKKEGIGVEEVLKIEKELERVRGKIETIKGEQRYLKDRVSYSTLTISLRANVPAVFAPKKKFNPGVRLSYLYPFDKNDRLKRPWGIGFSLHLSRYINLDLDVFDKQDDNNTIVLTTIGGALYSDFLGGGKRHFLNPYLGARLGYAYYQANSKFIMAGEAGIELLKFRYLLIDLNTRVIAFVDSEHSIAGLHSSLAINIPF